jgi:transglutaminase-like putative cysteine protease
MSGIIASRVLFVLPILVIAGLLASCEMPGGESPAQKYEGADPAVALDALTLKAILADGLAGVDDKSTAANILAWQDATMKYADPVSQADASYAMRWNYILPGIFPVSDMVEERVDKVDGKIYGVCWDYAAIFIAIARSYGLSARMTAWKKYMSGTPGGEKGMGPDEYEALKLKLTAKSLSYSYDQISEVARETWVHYRAEVETSDGDWEAFDGTNPTGDYAIDSNYSPVAWDEGAAFQ